MGIPDEPPSTDQLQPQRDPIEALATDFAERLRHGENPSLDDYAAAHPGLADDIRELFPTITMMEQVANAKGDIVSGCLSLTAIPPDRLGDYRIIREIGRGGMGIVYEAVQESLARRVAIKVLPQLAILAPRHLQRFDREARTAAGLHHSNIVPVFGVGQQDDCLYYYVMQYIEGVGLDRVCARLRRLDAGVYAERLSAIVGDILGNRRPVDNSCGARVEAAVSAVAPPSAAPQPAESEAQRSTGDTDTCARVWDNDRAAIARAKKQHGGRSYWREVARLGIQVADALEYAHSKGVLHRDIKPANLIIDIQGVVWVTDFGLAKAFEEDQISSAGDILGTAAYIAPERLKGKTDYRSDVYGLGLTLYEMLTLQPAYRDPNRGQLLKRIATEEPPPPRRVRPEIPRDLETIVLKAIAHEPHHRYSSARDLAAELRSFLEDRPLLARRTTTAEHVWRWCRRNPLVAGLSLTCMILLLAVTVVASIGYIRTTRALIGERTQRQRAQEVTRTAMNVLDRIYEQFAPPDPYASGSQTSQRRGSNAKVKPVLSEGAAAVLDDLLAFYDRLAQYRGSKEAAYLGHIALATRRVGDVRQQLNQLEQAKVAYQHAIRLYERLGGSSPDSPHSLDIATVSFELGIVMHNLGRRDEANESWERAIQIMKRARNKGDPSVELRSAIERIRECISKREDISAPPRSGPPPCFGPPRREDSPAGPSTPLPPRPPLSGRPRTSWGLSQFSSDENGTVPLAKVEAINGRPLSAASSGRSQYSEK